MKVVDEEKASPADVAWRGIELCRRGDWQEGLYWLGLAAESKGSGGELPGLFYAYLGHGLARYRGRVDEGLELCRRAVDIEFYQPESYYFLARTQILLGDRRSAIEVLDRGLQIDGDNRDLLRAKLELGQRRRPVISFLPRRHFLNRWLGRLRHRLLGAKHRD